MLGMLPVDLYLVFLLNSMDFDLQCCSTANYDIPNDEVTKIIEG